MIRTIVVHWNEKLQKRKNRILSNFIEGQNCMCTKFIICNKTLQIIINLLTIVQFDNLLTIYLFIYYHILFIKYRFFILIQNHLLII